ncbi:MAG: glutathione S-transferase family protein [Hyphomicrobiales bacterium]|jgi:glutathione S-transferase|nr:glutathione S-transferase family protein [Hyphomicrobiales bacterium]
MLTIWGRMNSINVQKAVWTAEDLGLSYARHDAGMAFGLVNTPEYRAMNPNGLVPVINDNGFVLWESNAIVRYLAARYGAGSAWPLDPILRAASDKWMDWQTTTFYPAYHAAFHGLVRAPAEQRDPAAIDASRAKTETLLAMLDSHLSANAYLGGDTFGIGDLALGPSMHRWLHMPIKREPRPSVEAWHKRIIARPSAACFRDLPIT